MKKIAKPTKIFITSFILILYTLGLLLYTPVALAEELSLSVQPAILQIEAIPPADTQTPLTLKNNANIPVKIKVVYKFFRTAGNETGEITYFEERDGIPGANKKILDQIFLVEDNINLREIQLGPKQRKKLLLKIQVPKNEPFSDYYFSIIFLSEPLEANTEENLGKDENNFTTARAGIAAHVLLSIGPKEKAKGAIEQFTVPYYLESGPVPFTLRVKNNGYHFMTPKGLIIIKNMFGQAVGRLEIAQSNILTGQTRALFDIDQLGKADNTHGLKVPTHIPQIIWSENFLLGFYTATLSLALSEQGPLITRTIHFVAFPAKILLGIFIAIIILILLIIRIRTRLSQE